MASQHKPLCWVGSSRFCNGSFTWTCTHDSSYFWWIYYVRKTQFTFCWALFVVKLDGARVQEGAGRRTDGDGFFLALLDVISVSPSLTSELGHGPCISPVLWGWQQQQLGCVSLLMDVSDGWCRWPQATIVSGLWLSAERSPEPTTQQQGPPRLQIALALYSPALLARLLALPTRQALSSALFCF